MADSRMLLSGLIEYRRVLGEHLQTLTANYQQLETDWNRFSSVYEGNAADQFRQGWMRTAQRFREYLEQTRRISDLLDERIEHLRSVDRAEGGLQ